MEGEFISRAEHEEHQRLEDEDVRQNRRLEILEETVKQIAKISTSVEKLALNMENMVKEQISQGQRLTELEGRDGEMWRKVVGWVISAVVGVAVGYCFFKLGVHT